MDCKIRYSFHMPSGVDMSNEDEWAWFNAERLHRAAASGDLEQIKTLLKEGCEIDAFEEDLPYTALHYAVMENHVDAARYLIQEGANVNVHDEARIADTPLGKVAGTCSVEIAELLIGAGADPTIPGWMQITALDRSEKRGDAEGKKVHKLLCDAVKKLRPN
jgi:ankyrin repeat protein